MSEIKLVHPANDIVDGILFLGYSDKEFNEKYYEQIQEAENDENPEKAKKKISKWKYKNYHVVVVNDGDGNVSIEILSDSQKEINGKRYVFEPDQEGKDRRLLRVNSKLSKQKLYSLKWDKKVDMNGLLHQIISNLKAYVELENELDYILLACWCVATYFHRVFQAFPYIHIKGIKGSGKSTVLDFITLIGFNASKESATFASMREKIDGQKATFLIDQADYKFGERAFGDMLDAVVGSYKKTGGKISKTVETKRGRHEAIEFDAYSPKGFASIRDLHHDLRDRCIQFQLYRNNKGLLLLKDEDPVWENIRFSLYKLLISEYRKVEKLYVELQANYQEDSQLKGRSLELWLPIVSMLELFAIPEETIMQIKNNFLGKLGRTTDSFSIDEMSVIERILDIMQNNSTKTITTKEISKDLNLSDEDEIDGDIEQKRNKRNLVVGRIVKKLNLYTSRKRSGKGYSYTFERSKVLKVRNCDPEISSQIFTTQTNGAENGGLTVPTN